MGELLFFLGMSARSPKKHRKAFVDMLLVEAPITVKEKSQIKLLKKVYCLVSSLSQEITTSHSNQAVWNEDCTFTLDDEYEEIVIELYEKKKHSKNILLGQVTVCPNNYSSGKTTDIWLEIQPPPACDSKYVVTGQIHLI